MSNTYINHPDIAKAPAESIAATPNQTLAPAESVAVAPKPTLASADSIATAPEPATPPTADRIHDVLYVAHATVNKPHTEERDVHTRVRDVLYVAHDNLDKHGLASHHHHAGEKLSPEAQAFKDALNEADFKGNLNQAIRKLSKVLGENAVIYNDADGNNKLSKGEEYLINPNAIVVLNTKLAEKGKKSFEV